MVVTTATQVPEAVTAEYATVFRRLGVASVTELRLLGRAGVTCTDGVRGGDEVVYRGDASGPRSAEMVLANPAVDVAALETARGGVVRRGLGYDRADVAVVTNITGDHVGADGIATIEDLIEVKSLVAEEIRTGDDLVPGAGDLKDAVGIALAAAGPGQPMLLHERLQPVTDLPRTLGASPA